MKSQTKSVVLIVEDNEYKAFTTRQVLELKLKLEVNVVEVESERELADRAIALDPDLVFFRPSGTVSDLILKLKKRHANRRNTEVVVLTSAELEDNFARKLQEFAAGYSKIARAAAA
jgi:DNA-binding NarL/FixJ family response regulator